MFRPILSATVFYSDVQDPFVILVTHPRTDLRKRDEPIYQ